MFYCENCGAELRMGTQFCEACGHCVPKYMLCDTELHGGLLANLFNKENWKETWAAEVFRGRQACCGVGILLINTKECYDTNNIEEAIRSFLCTKERQGIRYYCLDLSKEMVCKTRGYGSVEKVIQVLQAIYQVAVPDYLLIVGDTDSVGSKRWKNQAEDYDEFVCSDLPYSTMDLMSPWEGRQYDFENAVLVGRIPSCAKTGFMEACSYFRNYVSMDCIAEQIVPFGLSAFQWKEVSEDIYSQFSDRLLLSPSVVVEYFDYAGIEMLNGDRNPNLLYFNLHGSDTENYWYGQQDSRMPRAFSAAGLPKRNGYVIGVEACYGAVQINQNKEPNSILLEAMQNGCLAYVGSDTLAYGGIRRGQDCGADIIVSRFLYGVKGGQTFGESFLCAQNELWSSEYKDDVLLKTLAQFALYGDPSATLTRANAFSRGKRFDDIKKQSVTMPDVSAAISLSLIQVSAQIEMTLSQYIDKNYQEFSGIRPKCYQVRGSHWNQAIYTKQIKNVRQVLRLFYDRSGNVEREYLSR